MKVKCKIVYHSGDCELRWLSLYDIRTWENNDAVSRVDILR